MFQLRSAAENAIIANLMLPFWGFTAGSGERQHRKYKNQFFVVFVSRFVIKNISENVDKGLEAIPSRSWTLQGGMGPG